jgi:hypothetical protein
MLVRYLILISLLIALFQGCGNEGVMEGILNNVPFRMEVENVIAVRGTSDYQSDYNWMYPQVPTNPVRVYIGNNFTSTSAQSSQSLIIYIFDMTQIIRGVTYPVPSYNIDAELTYLFGNKTTTTDAIEGGYIIFDSAGWYESEEIAASFEFYMPEGTIYGSFHTRIGLDN